MLLYSPIQELEDLAEINSHKRINVNKYKKELEKFFPSNLFKIIIIENEILIESNDANEELCVRFEIFEFNKYKKYIRSKETAKCSIPGKEVISRMIKFAEENNFYAYSLSDASSLRPQCLEPYKVLINLAALNILATGQSWYNSFGFFSKYFEEEKKSNEFFINQTFEIFEQSVLNNSEKARIDLKNNYYDDENNMDWLKQQKLLEYYKEFSKKLQLVYSNFKALIGLFSLEITKVLESQNMSQISQIKLKDFFQEIQNSMRKETDFCNMKYETLSIFLQNISSLKELGFLYHPHPERLVKFFEVHSNSQIEPSAKRGRFSGEKLGGKNRKTRRKNRK